MVKKEKDKWQIIVNKTQHTKIKTKLNEQHQKLEVIPGAPEG